MSPALGSPGMDPALNQATSPTPARHFESGVSAVSEADRTHLRQISDTTVSSVMSGGGGDRVFNAHPAPTSMPQTVSEQLTPQEVLVLLIARESTVLSRRRPPG